MPNRSHRVRRPRTNHQEAEPSVTKPQSHGDQRLADDRPLLARLLDTPQLARVVPQLPADVLHRVIQRCGLEDCGEILALATPEQLNAVLDLDLWRGAAPGRDEQLDVDRFGVWLETLVDAGAEFAAQRVVDIDVNLTIAALHQHIRVFDAGAVSPFMSSDGIEMTPGSYLNDDVTSDIGGYVVVPRRMDNWDAIVSLLLALDARHGDHFHRLMRGCCQLSNDDAEIDGLDDLSTRREQAVFDVAIEREGRREQHGFVPPAHARAFLDASRKIDLRQPSAPDVNPIAAAYFRAMGATDPVSISEETTPAADTDAPSVSDDSASAVAAVIDVLRDAGVLPQQTPRALLHSGEPASAVVRIDEYMRFVAERDPIAHATRTQELGFLANVLHAGCSVYMRELTVQQATDAVTATCGLGIENWPREWAATASPSGSDLPDDFLVAHDLVRVFQVGWTTLFEEVCLPATARLLDALAGIHAVDNETQATLVELRHEMTRQYRAGTPWVAQERLEAIAILDTPTWMALLGLIGELPVVHHVIGALQDRRTHAVDAGAFDFIADDRQIASVRNFIATLPERLSS